jgi:polysaccharide biosynthesis transport protein
MLALTALRRHGPLVIVSSLIMVAGLATIVMMTFKPKYEAMTYLQVIQNPDYFQIIPERNQVQTDAKSELAPIFSEIVLRKVLVDEKVQRQPSFSKGTMTTKDLRKMLRYQSAGGQELYEVVAASPYPGEAVAVVAKTTEVFLDEFRVNRETRLGQLSEKLSLEIKAKSQKIDDLNRELGNTAQNMQGSSPDSAQYDPEGQLLNDLKKSRTEKELQLKVLVERDAKMLQSRLDERNFPIEDAELTNRVQQSPEVVALRQRIDESKRQLGQRPDRGSGHPDVLIAKSQIRSDERTLDELITKLRAQAQESWIAENVRSTTARLNAIDDEIQNLKMEIEYYDDKIAKQYAVISSASREKTKLSMSQADLENLRVEHSRLVEAENAIRLRGLSLPFQISQIELEVVVPTEPVERYPFKLLGISVLAGLGIPFALAFLWELRVNRVTTGDSLGTGDSVPLVGEVATLPPLNGRAKKLSSRNAQQLRLYQESVDNVSALVTIDHANQFRSIALTSAAAHEGKSTLSSQLAISLARSNHGRVLLVDTDLRSPTQHRLFNLDLQPGLAETIEQSQDWREVVKKTAIDNLFVITAGRVKSNPRRCFTGTDWKQLLEEFEKEFDIVIVDTPPVLATSESMMICRDCDTTLICMLRDVSRADSVTRAQGRLAAAGVSILGRVMCGVPISEYAYRYGSYGYNLSR